MNWIRTLLAALSVVGSFAVIQASAAGPAAKLELHRFPSVTVADNDLLTGHVEKGTPVDLVGELSLPLEADGRLPVVVLLHGSAGVMPYVTEWREELAAVGSATFIVDGFTPRKITSTIANQDQLGRLNSVLDAYRALDLLRSHPRIDPARIVVLGFSRGGDAALYSALTRLRKYYAPDGNGFAAHVAFYPNCGTTYRSETEVTTAPILLFLGALDDYAPAAPCRAYAERLKKAGADVRMKVYEGARHVFMWKDLDVVEKLDKGQTTRKCELVERDNGTVVNAASGAPFTHHDACVELGPSVAYNEGASADARKAVKALLEGLARR